MEGALPRPIAFALTRLVWGPCSGSTIICVTQMLVQTVIGTKTNLCSCNYTKTSSAGSTPSLLSATYVCALQLCNGFEQH